MRLFDVDRAIKILHNILDPIADKKLIWIAWEAILEDCYTIDAVEVVRCKDCKWFDKKCEDSSYGYCHAMKHCHLSKHWEISIYRTYKEDFYCADGEKMDEDEISNIAKESADKISKALEKVRAKGMQNQNIKEDDKP